MIYKRFQPLVLKYLFGFIRKEDGISVKSYTNFIGV